MSILTEQEKQQNEALNKKSLEEGFKRFMTVDSTKLALSLVPPGDNPDALNVLLKSAFDAGHTEGQSHILIQMLERMFNRQR